MTAAERAQSDLDVANRIASYVATHPDAANWGPQRWAQEAVLVILNDEGAAYDVLNVLHTRRSRP